MSLISWPRGVSREEMRIILEGPGVGQVDRFRIDFKPRFSIFRIISEENLIKSIHAAVFILTDWEIESVAFTVIDGNKDGIRVTVRRRGPDLFDVKQSGLSVGALRVAFSIITAVTVIYTVHAVKLLGTRVLDSGPATVQSVSSGFQFLALAVLAAVGFVIYKEVSG